MYTTLQLFYQTDLNVYVYVTILISTLFVYSLGLESPHYLVVLILCWKMINRCAEQIKIRKIRNKGV